MARIQYGSIVTGMSGKLGGHTYSRSGYGGIVMNKTNTPTKGKLWGNRDYGSDTVSGTGSNNAGLSVSKTSQAWKALTDAERQAWTTFSAAHFHIDPFGNKVSLRGYTFFMRVNTRLANIGKPYLTIPAADTIITDIGPISLTPLTTTSMKVNITNSIAPNEWVVVLATGSNSVGLVAPKKAHKFIQAFKSPVDLHLDVFDAYEAIKGAPLINAGVGVGVYVLNEDNGQIGPIVYSTNLVS